MIRMRLLSLAAASAAAATVLSCNLFAPPTDKRDEYASRAGAYALIVEGKLEMQDGNYEHAKELFDKAIRADSGVSEAYFYKGKCLLRIAGINLNEVWNDINPPDGFKNNVPFLFHENDSMTGYKMLKDAIAPPFALTIDEVVYTATTVGDSVFLQRKRIYDVTVQAIKNLEFITYYPERMDGALKRQQYEGDYLVEVSIKSVLGIIDINNNGELDYISSTNPSDEQTAFRVLCRDVTTLDPDSMNLDSLKYISKDPKDINAKIEELRITLGRADTSFQLFHNEIDSANLDTSMASGVGEMITKFNQILPFYYYDDYQDNDSCYVNTDGDTSVDALTRRKSAIVDRMIWIDWDQDGLIDINGPGGPHIHIGDSLHRYTQAPGLYANVGGQKDYQRYKYFGPHCYEWIFGDWSVDEEIMEGDDNDQDGLVDEDSRVVDDTLDDDGDWDQQGTPVKMVWNDAAPDFSMNLSLNATRPKAAKYAAIALLFADSLPSYAYTDTPAIAESFIRTYSGSPTGEFTGGDYGIDEEWFDGIDNDGDGLIDEDVASTDKIPPESQRAALIALLQPDNPAGAYHRMLHDYFARMRRAR